MNKKILSLLTACIIIPFTLAGCGGLVDESVDTGGNSGEMVDVFAGLMFTIYQRDTESEEYFVPVTSTNLGDDNCIAEYVEYSNKTGVPYLSIYASGEGYINKGENNSWNTEVKPEGSTRVYSSDSIIYFNTERFDGDIVFSFDELMLDKNDNIVREAGTVIASDFQGISEHSSTFETKQTITHTQTVNGKKEQVTETIIFRLTMALRKQEAAVEWRIFQYGQDGQMLECSPVTIDTSELKVSEECAFVVAEESLASGEVKRTLYEKDNGEWGEIPIYIDGGFGIIKEFKIKLINENSGEV